MNFSECHVTAVTCKRATIYNGAALAVGSERAREAKTGGLRARVIYLALRDLEESVLHVGQAVVLIPRSG